MVAITSGVRLELDEITSVENETTVTQRFFDLLVSLHNNEGLGPEQENNIYREIRGLLNSSSHLIKPHYINEDYESELRTDPINFFTLIDELNIPYIYKKNWIRILSDLLIQRAHNLIAREAILDEVWFLDKILRYNTNDTPRLEAGVRLITKNRYSFKLLKYFTENYVDALETLMDTDVMFAIRSRVLNINSLFVFRARYMPTQTEVDYANEKICHLVSSDNVAFLLSPQGSRAMFNILLESNLPNIGVTHEKMQDPEYFKLINSIEIYNLTKGQVLSLEFVLSLDAQELASIVNARNLSDTYRAINNIIASALINLGSSTALPSNSSHHFVLDVEPVVQQRLKRSIDQTDVASTPDAQSKKQDSRQL